MTKERIESIREILLPFVAKKLKEINYEGLGESDAKEFTQDFNEILNVAIKALEQEPKWIPVSERLPEDRKPVLVTAYWHETYQVMQASYFGDGAWWCVPFNNTGKHGQKLKPKAWMPLPKPYKAESEDKE